jgi:hypothetical protein
LWVYRAVAADPLPNVRQGLPVGIAHVVGDDDDDVGAVDTAVHTLGGHVVLAMFGPADEV